MSWNSSKVAMLCDEIEKLEAGQKAVAEELAIKIVDLENYLILIGLETDEPDTAEDISNALNNEQKKVLKFVEGLGLNLFDYERSKSA